ncbi:MAG: DNA-directed RNA polymerase subunit omega, partial [Candidatus Thorarchaeota archaeon]
MARVTVEDSLTTVVAAGGGIFHMILIAANRAHQLQHGAQPLVSPDKDKPTVIALREIAAGYTDFSEVVIPSKDAFGQPAKTRGPEVNRPRHWGTGSTAYIAGEE